MGAQRPAVPVGDLVELAGCLLAPGPLGGPVRGVDQGRRTGLARLGGRVVAQVGGEEHVDPGGAHLVEEAVAGAAAHRDGTDRGVRVARDPQAGGRPRQPVRGPRGELRQRQGRVQLAQPAQPAAPRGVGRVGYERAGDPQVHGRGERVGDAGVGPVGVGVGDEQRGAVADQVVHDAALEAGRADGRDRGRTAQVERVVGDQQVGADPYRLVDDLLHRVDGEQHAGHLGGRIAADQADRVPGLGQLRRPEGVEGGGDVGDCGHGRKVTRPRRAPGKGAHGGAQRPRRRSRFAKADTLTGEPPALALIVRKYENYGPVPEVDDII